MNDLKYNISSKIKELRAIKGFSLQDVAEAINAPYELLKAYEEGIEEISPSILISLLKLYNKDVDDFFIELRKTL